MENNAQSLVIKLGGAALSSSDTLNKVFNAIADYRRQSQRQIVIVHGGGAIVDDLLNQLEITTVKQQGLRVTPVEHIPFITGALAGTANKLLQAHALKAGLKSAGMCLADGGLCQVQPLDADLGCVGEAKAGEATVLKAILSTDTLPIISSIGLTDNGQLMNVNADQAAVAVAAALDAELVLLSDVSGVLDGKGHLIKNLTKVEADELILAQVITDGMIVKVQAALDAANALGRPIEVATWRYPDKLFRLFSGDSIGTQFVPHSM